MPLWVEVSVRTLVAAVALFLLTKILGKRQVSQLSLFEYLTGITMGNLVAYVSLDVEENWYLGLVALAVWGGVSLLIEYLQIKSKKARDFIGFKSTILIRDGKVLEDNLRKERLSSDELMEELRKKNVFQLADVEFALMEGSGEINVLMKREHQPLTPKHLGIQVGPEKSPEAVVMDGKVMPESLRTMGYSQGWLHDQLDKYNVKIEDVFLAQVDTYGQLTIDLYDDQVQAPQNQERELLFAILKKSQADLELFSLSTTNTDAKKMYENSAKQLLDIMKQVKPLLRS